MWHELLERSFKECYATSMTDASAPTLGIVAMGMYVPPRVVANDEYAAYLDTSDEWIQSRTGIRERRFAAEHEYSSHMGVRAIEDMVRRDPEALKDVDTLICATVSPDALMPSTGALIASQVGLVGATAFDLSTACSGFVYGLNVARSMVQAGAAKRVLVVGAEVLSKAIDPNDRNTAILFGDGAGAAVVGEVPAGYGFQAFEMGADGRGGHHLFLNFLAHDLPGGHPMPTPAGHHHALGMNGREVFKFAVRIIEESSRKVLAKAQWNMEDVKWVIPHQANIRILEASADRMNLNMARVVVNLDRYGNTSGATVPLALAEAVYDGRIQDNDEVLLVAFGGGLSWGACALKWWSGAPSLRPEEIEESTDTNSED